MSIVKSEGMKINPTGSVQQNNGKYLYIGGKKSKKNKKTKKLKGGFKYNTTAKRPNILSTPSLTKKASARTTSKTWKTTTSTGQKTRIKK